MEHRRRRRSLLRVQNVTKRFAGVLALTDVNIEITTATRVGLGRVLMTQPKVLLLDEPSSGLDPSETAALSETLQEVQAERGFSILLVEHDVELVRSSPTPATCSTSAA